MLQRSDHTMLCFLVQNRPIICSDHQHKKTISILKAINPLSTSKTLPIFFSLPANLVKYTKSLPWTKWWSEFLFQCQLVLTKVHCCLKIFISYLLQMFTPSVTTSDQPNLNISFFSLHLFKYIFILKQWQCVLQERRAYLPRSFYHWWSNNLQMQINIICLLITKYSDYFA